MFEKEDKTKRKETTWNEKNCLKLKKIRVAIGSMPLTEKGKIWVSLYACRTFFRPYGSLARTPWPYLWSRLFIHSRPSASHALCRLGLPSLVRPFAVDLNASVVVRWRSFISDRVRVTPFPPEPSTQRATFAFSPLLRLIFLRTCALLVYRCFPSGFSLLVSPLPLAVTDFARYFPFCIAVPVEVVPARFLLLPLFFRLVNKLLKMSMLLRGTSFLIPFALLRGEARQRLRERPKISANAARHARDAISRRRLKIAVGGVRFFLHCWGSGLAGVFLLV